MDLELKEYLDGRFAQIDARFVQTEERLMEAMRDMQTELLRGFAAHEAGMTLRLRKVEADHSNLDAAASGRIEVLERRLFQIEQRLGLAGLPLS